MFFYLSKILGALTMPSNLLVLATLFCLLGLIFRPSVFFRKFALLVMGLYLVLAIFPVANWATYTWEQKYVSNLKNVPKNIDGIVVLSAAIDPRLSAEYGQITFTGTAERVTVLPELMRRYPHAKLVYTGGSGLVSDQKSREADFAKQLFKQWKMPSDRIIFERNSRNTFENAAYSKKMVKPKKNENWLLVTSAMHLPRSAAIFKKLEWDVIPYPVDFNATSNAPVLCFCFDNNLTAVDGLMHEWIGFMAYRVTGKL